MSVAFHMGCFTEQVKLSREKSSGKSLSIAWAGWVSILLLTTLNWPLLHIHYSRVKPSFQTNRSLSVNVLSVNMYDSGGWLFQRLVGLHICSTSMLVSPDLWVRKCCDAHITRVSTAGTSQVALQGRWCMLSSYEEPLKGTLAGLTESRLQGRPQKALGWSLRFTETTKPCS